MQTVMILMRIPRFVVFPLVHHFAKERDTNIFESYSKGDQRIFVNELKMQAWLSALNKKLWSPWFSMTLNCHIRNSQDKFSIDNACFRNKSMNALDYVHNFPTRNFLKGTLSTMKHCGHGKVHNLYYKKFVQSHHIRTHYLGEGKTVV